MKKALNLAIALGLVLTLGACSKKQENSKIEYTNVTATKGSLTTTISLSGEVKSEKEVNVNAPYDLSYGMLDISVGDYVEEGQVIGHISKEDAIKMKEGFYEEYKKEIEALNGMTENNTEQMVYKTPVSGYLRNVKIREGESISDVMEKYGYLAQITDSKGNVLYNIVGVDGICTAVSSSTNKSVKAGDPIVYAKTQKDDFQDQINKVNDLTERLNSLNKIGDDGLDILSEETGVVSSIALSVDNPEVKINTKLYTVVDPQKFYVSTTLSESNYSKVSQGQSVIVEIPALNKTFSGKIDQISSAGTNGAFPVKIKINDAYGMKLGMTANIKIISDNFDDKLVVPLDSVYTYNDGRRYVLLANDKPTDGLDIDTRAQVVEVGATDGKNIEIVSGLEEGQVILQPVMAQYVPNKPTEPVDPDPDNGGIIVEPMPDEVIVEPAYNDGIVING